MKAAFYYNNDDIRIEEIPVPKINESEVLVKVHASGICGSDVMWEYRKKKTEDSIRNTGRGLILGHEIAGEIIESKNKNWKNGTHVAVAHHVPCENCSYCKDGHETTCEQLRSTNIDPGGFAEFIRVPAANVQNGLHPLPNSMSYETGTFVEPLGCVIRGQRSANIRKDDTLLIIGCGITGILHLKLALTKEVRRVYMTDVDDFRLQLAKKFGASVTINAKDGPSQAILATRVIVCTGSQDALTRGLSCLDRGGVMLYFAGPKSGVSMPIAMPTLKDEITFTTSYGASPKNMHEAIKMLTDKLITVEDMVTHKLPLGKAQEGFNLTVKPEKSLKIIICPSEK